MGLPSSALLKIGLEVERVSGSHKNQITNITPLSQLVNLKVLYLAGNPISDFTPVEAYYGNLVEKDFDINNPTYTVSGYIEPDFIFSQDVAPILKAGFKVEIVEIGASALTDENGYFKISGVNKNLEGYTLKISKPNYLSRELVNILVDTNVAISDDAAPLKMWAGDMIIDGNQDGAINMTDIMQVVKSFNSAKGDSKYNADCDLNMDGAINMTDIMIVVRHFNKTSGDYPQY